MELLEIAPLLFVLALSAGMIDAIAGGGGLITVPALLWAGLAPVEALGDAGQSVLFVLAEKNENVQRSAGNLSQVKVLLSSYLNIRDILGYDLLVFSRDAIEQVEVWLNVATEENGAEPVAPESDVTELDVTESDVAAATEAEE